MILAEDITLSNLGDKRIGWGNWKGCVRKCKGKVTFRNYGVKSKLIPRFIVFILQQKSSHSVLWVLKRK